MTRRILLILCCLALLVVGSGCYVYTAPEGGYYPDRPRRYHYHPHPHWHDYPYYYRR